ncbi:mitochondrial sodium/calcium exchanger protein isoform X2 [Drosophila yakuba]|uniref:mitochondrial sodium/calcium exchanger protein isoform X2 n=1 Tax=Drosophila yakuba TaxID=7245 RepID=UPI001930897A|nr:mitochondrial sodium/calcium exchanger protein isoform X2 [Drosophila yakuba]
MAFVDLSAVNRCSLPKESFRNANETCGLARGTLSCGSFVYLINYLDISFCVLKLPTISFYGLISAFLLMVHLSLLFMLTKYLWMPAYFVLSNIIPVISRDRILIGWNKYASCLGLVILPIMCMPHGFKAASWLIVLLTCWTLSILTFISTYSLRRPDNIWMFALLGLIISSVFINLLSREIENITYQYISMQFDVMPDMTALMYFGVGEMFSESIVVRCLQQRKMWDATFGVVMSLVTYAIFLAFPLLFYQGCYNPKCSIIVTSSTETAIHFIFLILSTSLLHISLSGYEFRISLLFYLLVLAVFYVTLQWMTHYDWILSLATLFKPKNND